MGARDLLPFFLGVSCAVHADVAASESSICLDAAARVERQTGLPEGLLQAISAVETGRSEAAPAWPWSANVSGKGYWFETRAAAEHFVTRQRAAGQESVDIGCFQINSYWHGSAFGTWSDMLDPELSAAHAAGFLTQLRADTGGWPQAIAAYHSRTPRKGARYANKVKKALAKFAGKPSGEPGLMTPDAATHRPGGVPLAVFENQPAIISMRRRRELFGDGE